MDFFLFVAQNPLLNVPVYFDFYLTDYIDIVILEYNSKFSKHFISRINNESSFNSCIFFKQISPSENCFNLIKLNAYIY